MTIHDSTKVNNNCSPWPLSENQCQWMSVNLRPTLSFLPSITKLQVFSPVIIVFVSCLRNSKKPVTGTSLAAQMNDKCKWMSLECYPLISQLAGYLSGVFFVGQFGSFFWTAFFFHFYWIRNYSTFCSAGNTLFCQSCIEREAFSKWISHRGEI